MRVNSTLTWLVAKAKQPRKELDSSSSKAITLGIAAVAWRYPRIGESVGSWRLNNSCAIQEETACKLAQRLSAYVAGKGLSLNSSSAFA